MRCLILDDEELARRELRHLLEAYPWIEIVGEAANVEEAMALAASRRPEAVFLDVELQGETGFDFLSRLPEPLPRIVFVTAYDEYAVRGFECNALDYLLKPVHPERLAETIARLRRQTPPRRPADGRDAVFLKIGAAYRFIPWCEVHHVVSEGNYTRVFFEDCPSALVLKPLKEWLDLMPREIFLHVHRTALVRRSAIAEIRHPGRDRRELLLSDGSLIPVGPSHWPALKAALS